MVKSQDEDISTDPFAESGESESLEALVNHQEVFLERSEEIKKAIEISIENYGVENIYSHIYSNIEIAIVGSEVTKSYDDGDWESLRDAVVGYIHCLTLMESGSIEYIEEQDPSTELQRFLITSLLEYGPELQRINYYRNQGKEWWSSIKTDQILGTESVKHRHTLTIDREHDVNIDSTPYSDWVLIEHLLDELINVIDLADDNLVGIINAPYFEEIRRHVYFIEELARRSESDIGMTDREEIRSAIETALENEGEQ